MSGLKPCPFCGATLESHMTEAGPEFRHPHNDCLLSGEAFWDIERWNRRSTPPEVAVVVRAWSTKRDAYNRSKGQNVEEWAAKIVELGGKMRVALDALAKAHPEV